MRRLAAVVILAALASCGGPHICSECAAEDFVFYRSTWLTADPGSVTVNPGEEASALVSVGHNIVLAHSRTIDRSFQGVSIVPPTPGVTLTPSTDSCVAPAGVTVSFCNTYRLNATAAAIAAGVGDVTLSAIWIDDPGPPSGGPFGALARVPDPSRTIERVEIFRISLTGPTSPPPVVPPDFQVAVGAPPGGIYATVATLPVTITRVGGFAEAVTLEYSLLASGIGGGFIAEPVPTDSRRLQLQIPARFARGGFANGRVTATAASGRQKVVEFSQFIEPLFRINLEPATASLTSAAPLRVEVRLEPGRPFQATSLGPVELSFAPLTPLPPGVTSLFLPDATPVGPVLPAANVSRTLQLVSDGRDPGVMGPLTIRATARGLPADIFGVVPFVDATLALTVLAGQLWQFVGNNLTYGTREANVIGMALQSDNRPALAWVEGISGRVFMRRYDGTTFAPSPPRVANPSGAIYVPALSVAGGILEASFALSATDAGHVAFTYDSGARLAVGRADRAGVDWSIAVPIVVGDAADPATPRARSPRVAIGTADPIVVSYIREANAATTTGGVLQVLRSSSSGILSPLPTSLPGGSLNASPVGSVVRHATALALRADGNPWVAWVEQPTDPALLARLWLRGYDGNDWGPAIAVTTGTPVGTAVQMLVEPSGQVVVAWLEGSPAQLKLARYDPSSQTWTPLGNTGIARSSLNVTTDTPAVDVHLAREPGSQGRLLVTWTEGGADPRVWIKRQNATGRWDLVGTTVSQIDRWSKTPRIVSDSNNRLYVAWATYAAGQNPGTNLPYAEIDVAQWIFP